MNNMNLNRASYKDISLYAPNRAPSDIDLSDNTNMWGVPPAALRVIREAAESTITRYPALYCDDLKRVLADYMGVEPGMIVTGCGSDDVLDSAIRAFGEPGDTIVYPDPSFPMIPIFAKLNGLRSVAVPLTADYSVDPDAFLKADAKITYLCSPNNPTGVSFDKSAIDEIIRRAKGLVIVDEAYAEFAGRSVAAGGERSNVLVTRTLSKAFGLAGLRIGYAVGSPEVVAEVEKSRGPYKVNSLAERAAMAALTEDMGWVREKITEAKQNRQKLIEEFEKMGLKPLRSDTNFVMVPVNEAVRLDNEMRKLGVAVRPFSKLAGIGDALRVSVGPWPMMERFLDAFRKVI